MAIILGDVKVIMKTTENTNTKVFSNFIWRFAERCGAQLVSFIVSIVLARILEPDLYGTIALVTVFINILQVFVDSGLASALIQKKDADNLDFSTVFFANVSFCVVLYIFIFMMAPFIGMFYHDMALVPIVRVLSITILISGVKNVQQAYVSRNLLFRKFFFSTLGGTIMAVVVGIVMAVKGYGIWALVTQQLLNATVDTMILWITVKWRPQFVFSFGRLKGLFSYGWKLLASGLLDTVYNSLRQLIIGKMYTPADLAYYNKGDQLPNIIVTNINSSIDSVLLPVMSKEQDDGSAVKNMTRRAIKISTYIMAPLMMGLAFTSHNVIVLLLTEKWVECIPFLSIFCITYMFWPIHTANLNAIKAMGRSDIFLKLEILKKIVGLVLLLVTMRFGVMAMAYSLLVSSVISQIINSAPNKKLLNYGYLEQLKDILPNIIIAIVMGVCVSFVPTIMESVFATLFVQVILGIGIYVLESIITKNESFYYFIEIVNGLIRNMRKN